MAQMFRKYNHGSASACRSCGEGARGLPSGLDLSQESQLFALQSSLQLAVYGGHVRQWLREAAG